MLPLKAGKPRTWSNGFFEERPTEDGKPPRKFADYNKDRIKFDKSGNGEWVNLNDFIKPAAQPQNLGNGITLIRRI